MADVFANAFPATPPGTDYPATSDVRDGVDFDSGQQTGSLDLPGIEDVETGVTYDGGTKTGVFDAPAVTDVRDGVGYGANGTEFVGTLDVGGVTPNYPAESEVLSGVSFGTLGAEEFVGNVSLPSDEWVVYPLPYGPDLSLTGRWRQAEFGSVLNTHSFGVDGNSVTGTWGAVVAQDVREGINFGVSNAQVGNLRVPSVDDVRLGVEFDNIQNLITGTVTIPDESDVRAGKQYDANLSRTGTLDTSGDPPVFPAESDVRLGTTYGVESNPTQFTGNVRVPPVEKVELGYQYDTLDSLTGTLAGSAQGETVERDITVIRGDDYTGERALFWPTENNWPDLANATIKYGHESGTFEKAGSVVAGGVNLELTKAETQDMRGVQRYDLQATLEGGAVVTLANGDTFVTETETDVPQNQPLDPTWPG